MQEKAIISWKVAGIALGLLLTLATALVKPLGVSTQFVVTDAAVTHSVAPEFAEKLRSFMRPKIEKCPSNGALARTLSRSILGRKILQTFTWGGRKGYVGLLT